MNSELILIDISSDDEPDEFHINKPLDVSYDLSNQWHNDTERENVENFVDLDQYLNSVENSSFARTKNGAGRDDSDDDCMVLDCDPDKLVAVGDDERDGGDASDDLCIVGQKGQVACRDFPHSRHLCANFPFNATSHEKHCDLCHCFVCDSPAPCIYWGSGVSFSDHCHATDKDDTWKAKRKSCKKINTATLPPQKHPVSEHSFPPTRNPQAIFRRIPASTPIQPFKETSLRPCSATSTSTTYLQTQRFHQRRIPSEPPWRALPVRRVNHGGSALAPTSHPQFKRVGSTRSGLMSSTMTKHMQTASSSNQMRRIVLQRPQHHPVASLGSQQQTVASPITQCTPVTSQRSLCTPATTHISQNTTVASSEEDSDRQWQDILAGVAAALGVSDSISQSTMAGQPAYTANSPSPAFDIPIKCQMNSDQGMRLQTDLGQSTISSNSIDFDPRWMGSTVGQNFPEQGQERNSLLTSMQPSNPLVSGNNDVVSADVHLESFLAAVEEPGAVPGKEAGLPEADLASFLYELEHSWSSIENVEPCTP